MIEKKQTILVTGGAGFIGSHTVDALLEVGKAIVVLDIVPWQEAENLHHLSQSALTYHCGDVTDAAAVATAMEGVTHVLHLAALVSVPESMTQPLRFHRTNVMGFLTVLDAAAARGIEKCVYASSAAVYGNTEELPIREDQLLAPESPYALHKCENELCASYYAAQRSLPCIGVRYFNVYGSRQDPRSPYSGVVSIFVEHAQVRTTPIIFGDGEQTRDFVHVRDVADANVAALADTQPAHRTYNIAAGTQTSLNTLLANVAALTDAPVPPPPQYKPARAGDIKHSQAATEKAHRELGWTPRYTLAEGLAELRNRA